LLLYNKIGDDNGTKNEALITSEPAYETYKNWSESCKTQQVCHVSNGRGCYKQGDIFWDIVSGESIKTLFVIMQQFLREMDGQVSLILGFWKEGCEGQKKLWYFDSKCCKNIVCGKKMC